MSDKALEELEALFFAALEQRPSDRLSWLEQHCTDDSTRKQVMDLLAAATEGAVDAAGAVVRDAMRASPALVPNTRFGPYSMLRMIGSGGMGTVFEAHRQDAFEQRVAIKVLRVGLADPLALDRFQRERQVLARLEHPGIARLVDGGTARDGTPWVAMEFVDGATIMEFCRRTGLSIQARVGLFVKLCDAMAYAHHQLVVHRDLKPDNVLVDSSGLIKVLDFGIAKLLDDDGEGTATMHRAFTPTYASPEQVTGAAVSPASDVYSLGVMLYQLLTGELPYGKITSRQGDWIAGLAARAARAPQAPGTIVRALRGDLEAIILKSLRPEPERRYPSAAALRDDLQAYLDGHPVSARPDTAMYRASRLVKRYPVAFAAVALALSLLVAFVVQTQRQSVLIAIERDRALEQAAIADGATDFLVDLFGVADPKVESNAALSAHELLERGAVRIENLDQPPLVRARLMHVMGLALSNLGDYESGIELLQRGLQLRQQEAGLDSAAAADSHNRLGNILRAAGRLREAEPHLLTALNHRTTSGEADNLDLADSFNNVGLLQRDLGHLEPAGENLEKSIAMHLRMTGETTAVAVAKHNLALVRLDQSRAAAAIELARSALIIKRDAGLTERATYANSMAVLARALLANGEVSAARERAENSLRLRHRILPEDHPHIASGLATLADVEAADDRMATAEDLLASAVDIADKRFGQNSWRSQRYRAQLARLFEYRGKVDQAITTYQNVLKHVEEEFSPPNLHIATSQVDLGRALVAAGNADEAKPLLIDAIKTRSALLAEDHPLRLEAEWLAQAGLNDLPPPVELVANPALNFRLLARL